MRGERPEFFTASVTGGPLELDTETGCVQDFWVMNTFERKAEEMGWVEEEGELQCGLVEPGPV